jgi:hypothetical protein
VGAPEHEAHDIGRVLAEYGLGGMDRRIAGGEGRGEGGLIHNHRTPLVKWRILYRFRVVKRLRSFQSVNIAVAIT